MAFFTSCNHAIIYFFILFLFYTILTFWKVIYFDRELLYIDNPSNQLQKFINKIVSKGDREIHIHNLELFIQAKTSPVRRGSNSLVLLGLIGTVIGFILALGGIEPSIAGSPDKIAAVISSLIHGMYIAFYTTLVGTVLHFCLNLYNRILDQASVQVVNRIITTYVK